MNKAPYKVCLILDNPVRDLDGLVLLGRELARLGTEAYLVPMYKQGYEVPAICPDFVLMNYARTANEAAIRKYHKAGISVGVLDTEGGVWESEEQFVDSIRHKECGAYIDLYCLWGKRQYKALLEKTSIPKERMAVTGSPRYDFCRRPWVDALEAVNISAKPVILVISNFALAYPRYAPGPEAEIESMVRAGYERQYARRRAEDEKHARAALVEVIKSLASDFPQADIAIRPHPFENDSEYKEMLGGNIRVERQGTVAPWLKASAITLHLNSSVAVDAYLMGKPAVSLDWINTDTIRGMSSLSYDASHKARDYGELKAVVSRAISGDKGMLAGVLSDAKVKDEVVSWFHEPDGNASSRTAAAIVSAIANKLTPTNRQKCRMMSLYGSVASMSGWIGGIGRLALGARLYDSLRSRRKEGSKGFSSEKVASILKKLDDINPEAGAFEASQIGRRDVIIGRIAGYSIKIASKS